MSLNEIALACNGVYHSVDSFAKGIDNSANEEVNGVTIDSRQVKKGFLFVPIKGARVDGHDYIEQVMKAGALCTLSEKMLDHADFPYILVASCEQALKDIAEHYRQALGIKVVGITGSVGKTSTKEMIASVLSQKYNILKTAGNFNNEIGVPLTIFNLTEEHEVAILEMGINHFGEMTRLSKIARPDLTVITNIGECHLEFLGDRDGVLKAKTEIFSYMNACGTIILNGEDDKLATISGINDSAPHFFGLSSDSYTYADEIKNLGLEGTACTIHLSDERSFSCIIPIPGSHMVLNALAGASVGMDLGLNNDEIKAGIEALVPVSGRNNIIKTDCFTIIDDCYNANPVSMKASIDVIATATTRKVAILGDMGELGMNESTMHYDVGHYASSKKLDLVCCIGALSNHIAAGLKDSLSSSESCAVLHYETKKDFQADMTNVLKKHDSILIKASHFMGFEEIVEELKTLNL